MRNEPLTSNAQKILLLIEKHKDDMKWNGSSYDETASFEITNAQLFLRIGGFFPPRVKRCRIRTEGNAKNHYGEEFEYEITKEDGIALYNRISEIWKARRDAAKNAALQNAVMGVLEPTDIARMKTGELPDLTK